MVLGLDMEVDLGAPLPYESALDSLHKVAAQSASPIAGVYR
jgi:hypothetical protein